eukprot:c41115_g1_i1 orf=22-261(-)
MDLLPAIGERVTPLVVFGRVCKETTCNLEKRMQFLCHVIMLISPFFNMGYSMKSGLQIVPCGFFSMHRDIYEGCTLMTM